MRKSLFYIVGDSQVASHVATPLVLRAATLTGGYAAARRRCGIPVHHHRTRRPYKPSHNAYAKMRLARLDEQCNALCADVPRGLPRPNQFCRLRTAVHPWRPAMTLCPSPRPVVAALLTLCLSTPALTATQPYLDDFDTLPGDPYQAALPTASWRYQALGATATHVGPSRALLQKLDGVNVLRLNDRIDNEQRKGWSTKEILDVSRGLRLEARFNTMQQSPTTGIDELLEIWFIDTSDLQRFDFVGLSTPSFGRNCIFKSMSGPNLNGLGTHFAFQSNTWYRMVLQASPLGDVRDSILADDAHTRLISTDLGHTLVDHKSGVRLGFGQSMGQPCSPVPTDSALDYLQLTTAPIPEPGSMTLFLAGLAVLGTRAAAALRGTRGATPA